MTPEELEAARAEAALWKLNNPRSHFACGAKDRTARVPEPMHYDCRECKKRIIALLEERITRPHADSAEQIKLPIFGGEE